MKPAKKTYIVLCLVALIAVACGPVTAAPTATKIIPTNTIVPPTNTSLPEPSLTATLSPVEKIFTIPTRQSGLVDIPTPIATPSMATSSMRLTNLSEENYLHLIAEINEYSYENFPPFDDWGSAGNFIASQQAVAFVIQEYLYQFPQSSNADRLRWQLAFINSIMYNRLAGNLYGEAWMIGELENRLNRGEAAPDQLETILGKYWFDVIYIQPMENLFADDKTGWLYQVAPQVWADSRYDNNQSVPIGSMFFVVRETDEGKFEIYLLNSAWNFSFGVSHVFDITDHNQNGTPEIALFIGSHSGTMCSGNLFIYEWKENRFGELSKNNLSLRDCSENFEYSESDKAPAITFSGIFPTRTEQYVWNGDSYEFSGFLNATPLQAWRNSIGMSHFSYEKESEFINEILASGEAAEFRASYADYLRYRLGIVYALQSKQEEAVIELESLIASPLDPTRTVFTDMARKFLEIYDGDRTVYKACFQSRLVYDEAHDSFRDLTGSLADAKYEEIFGIPFDPISFGFSMCDEEDAFILMTKSISVSVEDIPSELRKNGVNVNFSKRIDANLDGNPQEWFIIFDTYNQFLIFSNGSQYQAKRLDTWIGDEGNNYSSTKVKVESWDQFQYPVIMVKTEDEFAIMEIDQDYQSKSLFYDFGVMEYTTAGQNSIPEIQLFFSKPSPGDYFPDSPYYGYRWSVSENQFKEDLHEYSLFILHDPEKAQELAEQVLPLLEEWKIIPDISIWWMPRSYYLAGLSYELAGNQEKAIEIYWQLWHDFPDSHYARLAEFKLEPISP